jgi:hypothetical protein
MRRARHVALWGRGEVHMGLQYVNLKGKNHLEDLSVGGRIILKCIFQEMGCGMK